MSTDYLIILLIIAAASLIWGFSSLKTSRARGGSRDTFPLFSVLTGIIILLVLLLDFIGIFNK